MRSGITFINNLNITVSKKGATKWKEGPAIVKRKEEIAENGKTARTNELVEEVVQVQRHQLDTLRTELTHLFGERREA